MIENIFQIVCLHFALCAQVPLITIRSPTYFQWRTLRNYFEQKTLLLTDKEGRVFILRNDYSIVQGKNTAFKRKTDQIGWILEIHFVHHALAMLFYCPWADRKLFSNVIVG